MLKEVLTVAKVAKKSSLFLGGVAFGTLGLKILASKEAKKGYSNTQLFSKSNLVHCLLTVDFKTLFSSP